MSILYYGTDGIVHRLGDMNMLMHYNHNHDALGRFASSNTARTIANNQMLIKANRDMGQTWENYERGYKKKADKYTEKINKKKSKNKDTSKYEKKLSKIKQEGKKYSEYKANARMEAVRLEKENQKLGKEFSKLVENSMFYSIQRDNLNRITSVEYDVTPDDNIDKFGKNFENFNRDLMSGKVNSMTDEELLKKYKRK